MLCSSTLNEQAQNLDPFALKKLTIVHDTLWEAAE